MEKNFNVELIKNNNIDTSIDLICHTYLDKYDKFSKDDILNNYSITIKILNVDSIKRF